MIVFSVMLLFSAICAWIMAKHDEEQESANWRGSSSRWQR